MTRVRVFDTWSNLSNWSIANCLNCGAMRTCDIHIDLHRNGSDERGIFLDGALASIAGLRYGTTGSNPNGAQKCRERQPA